MSNETFNTQQWTSLMSSPWALTQAAASYTVDAWQRAILYSDVRRQRGDQYRANLLEETPNVLDFASEFVMSGLDLPRPVNYAMVRILPTIDQPTDEGKRPFIVFDPRAGHGPGIGGFKPDSEIGAALKAGHPCYFVGFLPDPVPGQTIEDVTRADAEFVRRASELHPESVGKPAVIGNCQAGWQVLMAAALWPDLFGPIIVAGAPLSYWAGNNPMRYAGGLLGGSWLTAMTSDLGAGRFDGAWLVRNFESLNPANTWWGKQYNLYANVDTEASRYLSFEKYWGGYVFLNDVEMQYIVDNLFIGNKLSSAEMITSDGMRIDLRNIRSPIVVFCSYGDNITPPPQALGWITDLYRDDSDVLSHDQTIVFATHESIGHLGIFVSGSVGRKEHREFTAGIDIIDLLPAGVYRADVVDAETPEVAADGKYTMLIRPSSVDEVRSIVKPDPQSDRRFAAAEQISNINLGLYRTFLQPWVKACSSSYSAQWMQALHPLRLSYGWWSSAHPLAETIQQATRQIEELRCPVDDTNPFLVAEKELSRSVVFLLDLYRDHRDQLQAWIFESIYGSPWVQALAAQGHSNNESIRPHPGDSPEHREFMEYELGQAQARMLQGGLLEAGVRALFYVLRNRTEGNATRYRHAAQLRDPRHEHERYDMAEWRHLVRGQALLLAYDMDAAISAIPTLLASASADEIRLLASSVEQMIHLAETELSDDERTSLARMLTVFSVAAEQRNLSALPSESTLSETTETGAFGGVQKSKQQVGSKRIAAQPKAPRSPAQQKPKAQVKQPPAKRVPVNRRGRS